MPKDFWPLISSCTHTYNAFYVTQYRGCSGGLRKSVYDRMEFHIRYHMFLNCSFTDVIAPEYDLGDTLVTSITLRTVEAAG